MFGCLAVGSSEEHGGRLSCARIGFGFGSAMAPHTARSTPSTTPGHLKPASGRFTGGPETSESD